MPLAEDTTQPLVLADGTVIDPSTGRPVRDVSASHVEVPSGIEAQRQITAVRRQLIDLPVPPQQLNAVSLCVIYTMSGLSDSDIAVATSLTHEQVERIKNGDAYKEMYDLARDTLLEQQKDSVRNYLQDKSTYAAQRVVSLMDSENEAIGLSASKDVLDRAGHRPVDVVEHRMKVESELRIVHVSKEGGEDSELDKMIDITPNVEPDAEQVEETSTHDGSSGA